MRVKPYDGRSAQELRADGYFVVSRKFGRVARIDVSPEEYREWTKKTCRGRIGKQDGSGSWRFHIRQELPNSCDDQGGPEFPAQVLWGKGQR